MNFKNNRFSISSHCRQIPLFGIIGALLWAVPDAEANWRISPELGAGIEYDDNTNLNDIPGLSESDTSYAIDALAIFLYDSGITDFTITPRLRSRKFSDNSDLDSNDQFLTFDFNRERQKSEFRFRGDFSSESVRTAERFDVDFDIEDPGEIPADDTGRVLDTGKRDRIVLAPEFAFDLTERTSLSIDGNYQDTSYDDDVSLILNGFAQYSIGASLDYRWSEKDTVSFGGYTGKYEADDFGFDSESSVLQVGYSRELSERTKFEMFVGGDESEDENGEDQSNIVGEISVIHRYLTTNVIASYQRETSGNGSGERSLRDAVTLNISRDLSPKLTLRGGIGAYSTDALDSSNTGFASDDYAQFRASARWRVSRTLFVDIDYRYTDIDRDVSDNNAVNGDSNQIAVWVYWRPNPVAR